MKFELVQHYGAPVEAVNATFADPDFYAALADLPKVGNPEVLRCDRTPAPESDSGTDRVHLEVRMHFTGDLSAAARAVIDPKKLSWIDVSEHDLAARQVSFVLRPDHYADRFSCKGEYALTEDGGGTVRTVRGEVKVRVLLVGDQVEKALVSGLREHIEREASVVEAFATG